MTAIAATFSDFKLVKTRGQAQFVFEVPVERADAVLTYLGGLPKSGNEVWIGFARLEKASETAGVAQQEERPICNREVAGSSPVAGTTPRERRPFSSLPRSQQAVLLCKDERFWKWLGAHDEKAAAEDVRDLCRVQSRSEFDRDPAAGSQWDALHSRYRRESGLDPEPRG